MPILLLPPPPILTTYELEYEAKRRGWEVHKPPTAAPPMKLAGRPDLVLYGDWRVVTAWANSLQLAMLGPTTNWLPDLPAEYLQRWLKRMTFAEALQLQTPAFVKPATTKGLAQVYASGAEIPDPESRPPEEPMFVAEPVTWGIEFRCFVRDRQVAAISPYYRGGRGITESGVEHMTHAEHAGALAFAQRVLSDSAVAVPPALTLDVGWIEGRGWAVIESGPAWFCAKYFCDARGVLHVLERACVSAFRITAEDEPWVVRFGLQA